MMSFFSSCFNGISRKHQIIEPLSPISLPSLSNFSFPESQPDSPSQNSEERRSIKKDVSWGGARDRPARLRDFFTFLFAGTSDELEIALTNSSQGNVKQIIFINH